MKVLAINSSPRKDKGNTAMILNPFLEGMKESGAEVELYYTSDLKINPCLGDFGCWLRTPGKCIQNDDGTWMAGKIGESDVLVLASPLYVDGLTGPMKTLIDRMIPVAEPFFELRDGHCRHPQRDWVNKDRRLVLVSSCGFWEMDNFDSLITHARAICKNANSVFAGALLRPHAGALGDMLKMGAPAAMDVVKAAKKAGQDLAREGVISTQSIKAVSQELMPRDMYMQMANQYFQEALKACEGR